MEKLFDMSTTGEVEQVPECQVDIITSKTRLILCGCACASTRIPEIDGVYQSRCP